MKRRQVLTTAGLISAASIVPARSAARRTWGETTRESSDEVDIDEIETSVIEETEDQTVGTIKTSDGAYVYNVDKNSDTMHVNSVGSVSTASNTGVGKVRAQAVAGVEIIKRGTTYRKKFGECSLDSSCIHAVGGGSVELNKYLAGVTKALIIAAIIQYLGAKAVGTRLASFIASARAKKTLQAGLSGIGTTALEGNSISLAMKDGDIFGKKIETSGIAIGSYKPGPSALIEFFANTGHVGCSEYTKSHV